MHLLPERQHLAEDGAGRHDRGGEDTAVGGDPEDAHAALLEDEQGLHRLGWGVEELAGGESTHRCCRRDGLHLLLGEVGEDVDLRHAPQVYGTLAAALHVSQLLTPTVAGDRSLSGGPH